MTEGATKLLRELALLLKNHPPEDFEELAQLLRKDEFVLGISRILSELSSVGRKLPQRSRGPGRSQILDALRSSDEKKYALLKEAQERMLDRGLHNSLADLVKAIETCGVVIPRKTFKRREEVVLAFLRCASQMPVVEIEQALARIGVAKSKSDLQSWSNMIMPKKDFPRSG